MVQAGLVAVKQGERGAGARERFKGEGQSDAFVDVFPLFVDIFSALFHLDVKQTRLDGGVTGQAPLRRGELQDQISFRFVGGSEMLEVVVELGLVLFLGLVGQNDGFRGQTMLDRVERGGAAAVFGFRTVRFCSVDAGCFGSGKRHSVYLAKV
jgi:hypothetical protein